MKKYILSFSIFLVGLNLQAQEKWSLRQCIDYAVENNIEIKQQSLQVENAKISLSTSKNSRLPDLNANVNQGFNFGRSLTANNVYESVNASNTSFGLSTSVPLFTGFQIPNEIKAKRFDLMAATEDLKKAQENLELKVTSLFLEVLFKKEILKVYQEQLDLTSKQVEKTKMLVEAGRVPLSQQYDIISQQAKDELNITTASNGLELSLLDLFQALNIADPAGHDIIEPQLGSAQIEANQSSLLPPSEIYQIAVGVKPHVKSVEYSLESSKRNLAVARSGYYPTLSLGMGYNTGYYKAFGKPAESFSKQINNQGRENIGFTLSIPLFNRFQTRNRVRSAQLNIENDMLTLDNVKLALYKEIQQASQSAVAAKSKFTSTEKAYAAASESFKYAEERYAIGKSTVFEFSEAQTKLLSSKSEQIQAKYDFLFRTKILDFYRGIEIDL